MRYKTMILIGLLLVAAAVVLAACGPQTTEPSPPPPPTLEPLRTSAAQPTPEPCPEVVCPEPEEPAVEVPFFEMWAASPHADASAEAFIHWDEEDPQELPVACAKCHSTEGFIDFVGADGSNPGEVNTAPLRGSVITCTACHNEQVVQMTNVVFPSGIELVGLGPEARCMQCHQGRASLVQVDAAIERVGLTGDLDTTSAELSFVNIHYYAAAATQFGTQVKGGYEYEGLPYDSRFDHVEGYNTCVGCHDSHTLEVKLAECVVCHEGLGSVEDVQNIRFAGSLVDYDGDGDIQEGVYFEVVGLQEILYSSIQAYASEVAGTALVYDSSAHPYFFIDTNENGETDEGEATRENSFNAWTPRLLKAGYNYQTSLKDPGAFAHGGKYIIQLLHDSIADLNESLSSPVNLEALHRDDPGHFQASSEAFRHWDADGLVPGSCSKCHTAGGLPQFLGEASRATDRVSGVTVALAPSSGLNCATCHDDVATFTRFQIDGAKFPSNAVLSFGEANDNNLCIQCHQGREANRTVQDAIRRANVEVDTVSETLSFRNPHYFAAGATLFGSEAAGAFQYDGKEYNGRFMHVPTFNTCTTCHDAHALEIRVQACAGCHPGADSLEDLRTIRQTNLDLDYDVSGAVEGVGQEVASMHQMLYEAIQQNAVDNPDTDPIAFGEAYPYWFRDANANGIVDGDESGFQFRYVTWTPRLLAAAYNYTWVAKDPGAFAHNPDYIVQILYDSLEDIGADVSNLTRPPVEAVQTEQ
jgi:hypothetical protein